MPRFWLIVGGCFEVGCIAGLKRVH